MKNTTYVLHVKCGDEGGYEYFITYKFYTYAVHDFDYMVNTYDDAEIYSSESSTPLDVWKENKLLNPIVL